MLRLINVSKVYDGGVVAVDCVSLEVPDRQFAAVMGRSGSGKSTLLNLIAGIDRPTSGEIRVGDRNLATLGDDALTRLRRERLGIVFQFFNLLTTLDVRENVAMPLLLEGIHEREALERADTLIEAVGLQARARSRPAGLSGGEMQRAAIARALIHRPALLLADEPTGNLDSRSAAAVLQLMRQLAAEADAAVLLVTHSAEAAASADRVLEMSDGRIVGSRQQSAVSGPLEAAGRLLPSVNGGHSSRGVPHAADRPVHLEARVGREGGPPSPDQSLSPPDRRADTEC